MDIPGSNTSVSIAGLQPMTTYHFRLQAENALGRSPFGETVTITTDEEGHFLLYLNKFGIFLLSIKYRYKIPKTNIMERKISFYISCINTYCVILFNASFVKALSKQFFSCDLDDRNFICAIFIT